MSATYGFTKSPFTAADLKGKSVEFHLTLDGETISSDGKMQPILDALDGPGGIRVAVIYGDMATDRSSITGSKVLLPAEFVGKLVKNPPGAKTEFSIKAP